MEEEKTKELINKVAENHNLSIDEIIDIAIWKFANTSEQNQNTIIELYKKAE